MKNELYHHGVKGMRWGVRRYQNEDGTLTTSGKERRNKYQHKNGNFSLLGRLRFVHDVGKNNDMLTTMSKKDESRNKKGSIIDLQRRFRKESKKMKHPDSVLDAHDYKHANYL